MEILTLGQERTPRGQCLNRSLSTLYMYEVQRLKSLTLLAVNGENRNHLCYPSDSKIAKDSKIARVENIQQKKPANSLLVPRVIALGRNLHFTSLQ